jgi:hypothetical protein
LLAQLGEGYGSAPAERIAVTDREDQRLGGDHAGADPRRQRLSAEADDPGVDVAAGHALEERLVVLLGELDLDCGMGTMEIAERFGEATINGPGDTDPQPSMEHAPQGGDRVAASLRLGERRPRVWEERLAGPGEGDRARIAMKEHLPELALQAPDLRADRRLGHRHAGSRARELALLGHRHEVGELPQVHNDSV